MKNRLDETKLDAIVKTMLSSINNLKCFEDKKHYALEDIDNIKSLISRINSEGIDYYIRHYTSPQDTYSKNNKLGVLHYVIKHLLNYFEYIMGDISNIERSEVTYDENIIIDKILNNKELNRQELSYIIKCEGLKDYFTDRIGETGEVTEIYNIKNNLFKLKYNYNMYSGKFDIYPQILVRVSKVNTIKYEEILN